MSVVGGLFGLVFMGMLFSVYTLGAAIMTAVIAAAIGIRAAARSHTTRSALRRRADWEHAALAPRAPSSWGPPPPRHGPLPPVQQQRW